MNIEKRLDDMIRKAQHSNKRQKRVEKKDWRKAVCPYCQKTVQYIPTTSFKGVIKCPHCGREFVVPKLGGWE